MPLVLRDLLRLPVNDRRPTWHGRHGGEENAQSIGRLARPDDPQKMPKSTTTIELGVKENDEIEF
jgi:hypothetical protein